MQVDFFRFISPEVKTPVRTLYSEMVTGESNSLMLFIQFPDGVDPDELWRRVYAHCTTELTLEIGVNGMHYVLMAYGTKVDAIAERITARGFHAALIPALLSFLPVALGMPYPFQTPVPGECVELVKEIEEILSGPEEG